MNAPRTIPGTSEYAHPATTPYLPTPPHAGPPVWDPRSQRRVRPSAPWQVVLWVIMSALGCIVALPAGLTASIVLLDSANHDATIAHDSTLIAALNGGTIAAVVAPILGLALTFAYLRGSTIAWVICIIGTFLLLLVQLALSTIATAMIVIFGNGVDWSGSQRDQLLNADYSQVVLPASIVAVLVLILNAFPVYLLLARSTRRYFGDVTRFDRGR